MKRRTKFIALFCALSIAALATEMFTGIYDKYNPPFPGSGIFTTFWVAHVQSGQTPLTEVDRHSIESAVFDSANWVFVVHYYLPDHPDTIKQAQVLERLNAHYGGKVTFIKLDLTKHRDIPFAAGLHTPVVVVYALERAQTDPHKMVGYYAHPQLRGNDYHNLLMRIQACRVNAYFTQLDPPLITSVTSQLGGAAGSDVVDNHDDRVLSSRRVPFWNYYSDPENTWRVIASQQ